MFLKKRPELIPDIESREAVNEAYRATAALRSSGVTGYVLVKCTVAKDGSVEEARAVLPPRWLRDRVQAVLIDAATGEELPHPPPHTLHPELCRAAETAVLKYRFRPATLFGRPVRYHGIRLGMSFDLDS